MGNGYNTMPWEGRLSCHFARYVVAAHKQCASWPAER
jgi:hypothetical protein